MANDQLCASLSAFITGEAQFGSEMECFEPLKGFKIICQACDLVLRNRNISTVSENMFAAVSASDDHLDYIVPRGYAVQCSNITACACLQSLQWSLYPVSVLRRTKTAFR